VLLGLAVVAVFVFRSPGGEATPGLEAPVLPDPTPAPELALRSIDGETVRLSELRGEVVLVFFGFANCPDVCPLTLARWSRALEVLESRGYPFRGIFVSVDPDRDTPEALERWMSAFHPDIRAVTGSSDEIAAAAEAWNVHVRIHRGAGGDPHAGHGAGESPTPDEVFSLPSPPDTGGENYLVEHSSRTFVVDREGRVVRTFPAFLDAEEIVTLLEPILAP